MACRALQSCSGTHDAATIAECRRSAPSSRPVATLANRAGHRPEQVDTALRSVGALCDKGVDRAHRLVLGKVIVETLGQQHDLAPILTFDESLHAAHVEMRCGTVGDQNAFSHTSAANPIRTAARKALLARRAVTGARSQESERWPGGGRLPERRLVPLMQFARPIPLLQRYAPSQAPLSATTERPSSASFGRFISNVVSGVTTE